MPARVAEIVAELDALLEPARFQDYCPNGLQVPGPLEAETIVTAVSASAELFELAARERADLLLVHHGLFWGQDPGPLDAQMKRRLKLLFDADIALAAYHLPLDAHPEVGNNALLAKELGAERLADPFAMHEGEPIGCLALLPPESQPGEQAANAGGIPASAGGTSADAGIPAQGIPAQAQGIPAQELFARVRTATEREPLVFDAGPAQVHKLAIVSGAGSDYIADAASAGADALLTGEPAERAMSQARELGVHFIAAGHYATETFGVRAVGERLAERFGVRHVFLDVPNPV